MRGDSTIPIQVMKTFRKLCHGVIVALTGFIAFTAGAQTNDAIFNETTEQRDARMAWFRVVKVRTGLGSASQGTATWSSLAPTSMPAACGCSVGSWTLALARGAWDFLDLDLLL
jgi:hypothetical protein